MGGCGVNLMVCTIRDGLVDMDRAESVKQMLEEIGALVDRWWPHIMVPFDEIAELDDLDAAELLADMGQTYVGGWVLTLGVLSIDNPEGNDLAVYYSPRTQSTFMSRGLIEQVVDRMRDLRD